MKQDFANDYERFEREHWWFLARRLILRSLIRRMDWPTAPAILEIGVGSGENLYALYPPDARLVGIEPDPVSAERARGKGPVPVHIATVESLPADIPDGALDGITMFDVLEHTRDDRVALANVARKLKPGARLVLSVPAYMFLWGQQDEVSLHFRRYTRPTLRAALRESGFEIVRCCYFNTLLFPAIAGFRLLARLRPPKKLGSGSDFEYSAGPVNRVMYHLFAFERHLLRLFNLPFGISVYAEARWRGSP